MRHVLKTSEIESSKREILTPNKDVQFYWITVATDWGEEKASTLMNLMIYQRITIRGFSHVAAYMELTSRKIKREFGRPKAFDSNITFMKIYGHLFLCYTVQMLSIINE